MDPADYVIENLNGSMAYKSPGSVSGQQFVIRNCQDASIYLLDHAGSVTVDDCQRCTIVLGPTKQRWIKPNLIIVFILILYTNHIILLHLYNLISFCRTSFGCNLEKIIHIS